MPDIANENVVPSSDCQIERDLPCMACGYNLKTLAITGNCPECGCPARQSWIRSLRSRRHSFDKFFSIASLSSFAWGLLFVCVIVIHDLSSQGFELGLPFLLLVMFIICTFSGLFASMAFSFCLENRRLKPALIFVHAVVISEIVLISSGYGYEATLWGWLGSYIALAASLAFCRFSGAPIFTEKDDRIQGFESATGSAWRIVPAMICGLLVIPPATYFMFRLIEVAHQGVMGQWHLPTTAAWHWATVVSEFLGAAVGGTVAAMFSNRHALTAILALGLLFGTWTGIRVFVAMKNPYELMLQWQAIASLVASVAGIAIGGILGHHWRSSGRGNTPAGDESAKQ